MYAFSKDKKSATSFIIQPELSTAIILSTSLEPKSKIVIKKKPKAPKQEPEPPPKAAPEIELPSLRHSKDETQAPLVSKLEPS